MARLWDLLNEQEQNRLDNVLCGHYCSGCFEYLMSEGDYARHFVAYTRTPLRGSCPDKHKPIGSRRIINAIEFVNGEVVLATQFGADSFLVNARIAPQRVRPFIQMIEDRIIRHFDRRNGELQLVVVHESE